MEMIRLLFLSVLAGFALTMCYVSWMHFLIEQPDSTVWLVALVPPLVAAVSIIIFKELKDRM